MILRDMGDGHHWTFFKGWGYGKGAGRGWGLARSLQYPLHVVRQVEGRGRVAVGVQGLPGYVGLACCERHLSGPLQSDSLPSPGVYHSAWRIVGVLTDLLTLVLGVMSDAQ